MKTETKPDILAERLLAIADYLSDSVAQETSTSKTLRESAQWLKATARVTCAQGIIGCSGGE